MHHNQNQTTCNGHPHIHRRLSQEQDGESQQNQTDDKLNELTDRFAKICNSKYFKNGN